MPGSYDVPAGAGQRPAFRLLRFPAHRSRPWAFLPHAAARNTAAQCILNKFCERTPDWVREFRLSDRPRLTAGLNFGKPIASSASGGTSSATNASPGSTSRRQWQLRRRTLCIGSVRADGGCGLGPAAPQIFRSCGPGVGAGSQGDTSASTGPTRLGKLPLK